MPLQSVRPATEQTEQGGAGSNLEEEKLQAIKENLMGSLEGEKEDNLDDIDKDDLDEFLMNKEGEVNVNKEKENKNRKLAEGKRKRRHDSKEDTVSRKRRRGPKSEVSVFDQQLQTMSGVEVKDGVAAGAIVGAVDNEKGGGEVENHLLNKAVVTEGGGEESPDGRQSKSKSLPCEYCGKTFKYQSMLDKHIASHTKPFSCEFCTRQFSRKDYLKWHLSYVHSVKKEDLQRYALFCYALVFHFIIR